MSKHDQFAALASNFVGRRGLLVEFGPTIIGCKAVDVSCDAEGMQARIICDDGKEPLTSFASADGLRPARTPSSHSLARFARSLALVVVQTA